jgi:hypothetical protein
MGDGAFLLAGCRRIVPARYSVTSRSSPVNDFVVHLPWVTSAKRGVSFEVIDGQLVTLPGFKATQEVLRDAQTALDAARRTGPMDWKNPKAGR